jgi:hypothetical protein
MNTKALFLLFLLFSFFHLSSANREDYQVVQVLTAPVIDGQLNDSVWDLASPAITGFKDDIFGEVVAVQTFVKVVYTENELCVSFRFEEPRMDLLVAYETQHDGRVWEDDSGVILLDVKRTQNSWYELLFNSINTHYDDKNGDSFSYNPEWESAIFLGSDFWSAEIKIAFTELETTTPVHGEVWGADFCRNRVGPGLEGSDWAGIIGQWTQPPLFCTITFLSSQEASPSSWGKVKEMFR